MDRGSRKCKRTLGRWNGVCKDEEDVEKNLSSWSGAVFMTLWQMKGRGDKQEDQVRRQCGLPESTLSSVAQQRCGGGLH